MKTKDLAYLLLFAIVIYWIFRKTQKLTTNAQAAGLTREDVIKLIAQAGITAQQVGALPAPIPVANVAAMNAEATGNSLKLFKCQSDPSYSTDPTFSLWDGTQLHILVSQKRTN